ncbi:hypothetical protein JK358_33725 [Nocardia sp. 2]|uniref:DUF1772 domain-containing protein n=1 Tax=Nocardia acididurans TaxID=2802282 RepID=A0ABS1MFF2_9NOCA|nr:hypothetical protein [Nocardia acididurans]MBL1079377.1 hypothetical protein [Nocardia acididurans]
MNYRIPTALIGGYATVAFFVFSATVAETWLLYPNIFRQVPESLVQAQEFMSVIAVGDVMRPLGAAMTLCALVAAVAALRYRVARRWLAGSLTALISGQFLLSILYLWPRASILFDDRDEHTAAEIDRAAAEFVTGQYFRIAAAGLAALCAVIAALECHRVMISTQRSDTNSE